LQRIFKSHTYSFLALLILSFALIQFSRDNMGATVLIDGDGSGHYAWLPTVFIHHTLDFTKTFENEKKRKGLDYQGHNYHRVNDILINKFPPGTALLMLPFFLLAMLISLILQMPTDGYNLVFQFSVGIAAVFWAWVGLVFLYKLLLTYRINPKTALAATLVSIFGTNLLAYTFLMPAFSHVYSFAIISLLLFYVRSYFLRQDKKSMIIAAVMFGLMLSIRPVNILIVVFLPFLGGNFAVFFDTIKAKLKSGSVLYSVLVFALAISPFIFINYFQTGKLIYFGYQNEGFYWNNPQILNFLFSFRKGWFVYTPIMLLLIPATVHLFKRNKFEFWWFIAFLTVLVYVFSSWWNWFFGDSFGMRPMVDFTVVFVLVIALWIKDIKEGIKSIALTFILLASMLNLVQNYQYAKGIIHPDSMSSDAYFYVFLKTDKNYSGSISGGPEYYYGKLEDKPFYFEFNDFENEYPNWTKLWDAETKQVFTGNKSVRFGNRKIYSPSLNWIIPDSLFNIQDKQGNTVFYKSANLKQVPDNKINKWRKMATGFKLPLLNKKHYLIKIYVWNTEKTDFVIDDFEVGFYRY